MEPEYADTDVEGLLHAFLNAASDPARVQVVESYRGKRIQARGAVVSVEATNALLQMMVPLHPPQIHAEFDRSDPKFALVRTLDVIEVDGIIEGLTGDSLVLRGCMLVALHRPD